MSMRKATRVAALTATVLALAGAAPAGAALSPFKYHRGDGARSLTIGERYWHERSCRPRLSWDRVAPAVLGADVYGWTRVGGCHTIHLKPAARRLSFEYLCVVVTHELGHALGYPHSTDPESIMAPALEGATVPGCHRVEARRDRRAGLPAA